MGVERLFSSLKRDYNFINDVKDKLDCEHLLIDFNSIVHVTSQFLLEQYKTQKDISKEIFEAKLIDNISIYIEDLLSSVFHKDHILTLTICIDGVPTMSKIFEQKKRRYMGDLLTHLNSHPSSFSWSRNNISPGTDFMRNLMTFLNSSNFEERIKKICLSLKHLIISGIDDVGEGEIKILHYIDKFIKTKYKNDNYVVYSPDSDVIILLLMTDINVLMLRYDQQKSTEKMPIYSTVDINKFKKILYEYVSNKMKKEVNKKNIIMDIVFILTVFGDDFLPKLETVRVNTDILLLIDHYILIILKYGYILQLKNSKYEINVEHFYQFLLLLQKKEDYFLQRNARYHIISNYNRIVNDIVGYNMNLLREYIVEYLWKFIYYNKPKEISITPINAHKYITIEELKDFINNLEPKLNMSKFTNMEFKNTTLWDKMMNIINEYYIEILSNINGQKMAELLLYSSQVYYVEALPTQLLKDIILYFYQTYELPILIPLKTSHEKILINKYYSEDKPHNIRLAKLMNIEKEHYKIENKLDKYFTIFNPKDMFYYDIYFKKTINYSLYYKIHFSHQTINTIVNDYLTGFNWVVNYYHNTNADYKYIDMMWYYRHNRSPLLKDIINTNYEHFNKLLTTKLKTIIPVNKYMKPLEHLVFVSPFNIDKETDLNEQLIKLIGEEKIDKIKLIIKFILSHKKYYYQLNKIYNEMKDKKLVDCSGSIFISKCHLLFMENYINMNDFLIDFRKYIL
jgi:5'-3' exonuclease